MNPGTLDPFTIAQMEWVTGIEPASPAWKAGALPLSYARMLRIGELCVFAPHSDIYVLDLFGCMPIRLAAGLKNGVPCLIRPRRVHKNMKLWDTELRFRRFLLPLPGRSV